MSDYEDLYNSHGGRDESGPWKCAGCGRTIYGNNEACYCVDELSAEESDDRPIHGPEDI